MSALLTQFLRPFEKYFKRRDVVEICINQPGEIWLETTAGNWEQHDDKRLALGDLEGMADVLATVTGQRFDPVSLPLLSTTLPGWGHRIQVVGRGMLDAGPNGEPQIAICIRVAKARRFDVAGYFAPLDAPARPAAPRSADPTAAGLIDAVAAGKKLLVVGGTGSGKTGFINSLLPYVPAAERLVAVEDSKELAMDHANRVRIIKSKTGSDVARVTYKHILNACMRLRPDRVLFGELDTDNTFYFLRFLNTGHGGGIATLHADSPEEAFSALVDNVLMCPDLANPPPPEHVRAYARKALDAVVFVERHPGREFRARIEYL